MTDIWSMKLRNLLVFCVALFATTVSADDLTVQNDTDGTLVYLLITPGRFESLRASADAEGFAGLFSDFAGRLDRIPPRGVRLLEGVPGSDLVLVGYIDHPDRSDGTVMAVDLSLQEEPELIIVQEDTALQVDGRRLALRSWQFIPDPAPIRIDNRYSQWVTVPDLAAFRSDFRPESFSRFTTSAQRNLALEDSLLWGRGGSRLERVKALRWETSLFVMAASVSEMSPGMSILMRLYPDRAGAEANEYTIEIPLSDVGGPVLLWSSESDRPRVVGDFVRTRFFVEAEIRTELLPGAVNGLSNGGISFDIGTRLSDHALLEEFHHTTGFVRDIPGFHGRVNP